MEVAYLKSLKVVGGDNIVKFGVDDQIPQTEPEQVRPGEIQE
jgi:hypothetical protein